MKECHLFGNTEGELKFWDDPEPGKPEGDYRVVVHKCPEDVSLPKAEIYEFEGLGLPGADAQWTEPDCVDRDALVPPSPNDTVIFGIPVDSQDEFTLDEDYGPMCGPM